MIIENDLGLEEIRYIPEAKDPKNVGVNNEEDKFPIYYFIDRILILRFIFEYNFNWYVL